jgi:pimeloyl-ACP methyl ester carboxylesterase
MSSGRRSAHCASERSRYDRPTECRFGSRGLCRRVELERRHGGPAIAAFGLDEGETITAAGADFPQPRALANVIVDEQGFGWLPEDDFVGHFASDVDQVKARAMHAAQQPVSMSVFEDVMATPAWKSLPSWYMVAANDEAIAPDEERMFAERMGAEPVEVASSHVAMISHPEAVVDLIKAAARQAAAEGAREGATA